MSQAGDEELVARCRAGSDAAFAEVVDRYKSLVFGVISQVVTDKSCVDDLAQDVFIRIYRGLQSFRGDAKLSTWIYRIVRNVCVETAQSRRPAASLDERTEGGRLRYEPAVLDPAFRDFEVHDDLEHAIAQLPAEQRFLISAHYFAGQQYQELADILDMPLGTVKTQLHRAKARLRVLLEQRTVPRES